MTSRRVRGTLWVCAPPEPHRPPDMLVRGSMGVEPPEFRGALANDLVTQPVDSDARRAVEIEGLRSSFAALHSQRLHGFALLLLLGDEARARELAAASVAAGMENVLALRHPERAAAWLRADLLRRARRRRDGPPVDGTALRRMGVGGAASDALGALDLASRAAVIAADVERLDLRDVHSIVGRSAASGARLLANARRRYVAAFEGPAAATGPIARRIAAIAATVGRFGTD